MGGCLTGGSEWRYWRACHQFFFYAVACLCLCVHTLSVSSRVFRSTHIWVLIGDSEWKSWRTRRRLFSFSVACLCVHIKCVCVCVCVCGVECADRYTGVLHGDQSEDVDACVVYFCLSLFVCLHAHTWVCALINCGWLKPNDARVLWMRPRKFTNFLRVDVNCTVGAERVEHRRRCI